MAKKKEYNLESKIVQALRKIWSFSPNRREALKLAKSENPFEFRCAICKRLTEKPFVDHKTPIGLEDSWDGFIEKLFCEPSGLQIMCRQCHKNKTSEDMKLIRKLKSEAA